MLDPNENDFEREERIKWLLEQRKAFEWSQPRTARIDDQLQRAGYISPEAKTARAQLDSETKQRAVRKPRDNTKG